MTEEKGHLDADRMRGMVEEMQGRNLWDEIFQLRDQQRDDLKKSV